MLRMGAQFWMKHRRLFKDAPRGSAIFFKIFRMLRAGARFSSEFSGCSTGAQFSSKFSVCSARERGFEQKNEIVRTLRTGAQFSSKFSRCSARERHFLQNFQDVRTGAPFLQNFQDAPHGSAIFLNFFGSLCTGARFCSRFAGCSARERNFLQNFQDAPHGSAIHLKIFRLLRRGAQFSSKLGQRRRASEEKWYRIHPLNAQIWKDEVDESYTKAIPEPSAKYRHLNPREPSRTKNTWTRLV